MMYSKIYKQNQMMGHVESDAIGKVTYLSKENVNIIIHVLLPITYQTYSLSV